ncbi:hypothetical protein AVP42_00713 [Agromyces sp. NDB4Y10]|uniref:hypothetical protein n=1 Tax=Agromyces sp. NDB4Y10 TaxID=1775951 RepID=UPI0007B1C36B|nr:hypothetical protein [Agromyces sp. NDB4Y10]KZE94786.1 hypothetical protein AVP42_00713 [Agromyces sp. NDB4Y10]
MTTAPTSPRRRRPLRWAAVAALTALSLLHLVAAPFGDITTDPYLMLSLLIGLIGLGAAARFAAAGCIESRLGMAIVAGASLVGALLTHVVGLPGAAAQPWSAREIAITVLAAGLLVALRVGLSSECEPAPARAGAGERERLLRR